MRRRNLCELIEVEIFKAEVAGASFVFAGDGDDGEELGSKPVVGEEECDTAGVAVGCEGESGEGVDAGVRIPDDGVRLALPGGLNVEMHEAACGDAMVCVVVEV